jgi:parallel beta-helix repeat protein
VRVASGAVLDCDHHTITGSVGNGWQVRNCRGLRLSGGGGHWLVGNEIFETNNCGIDLADATAGNRLETNVIRNSGACRTAPTSSSRPS